MSLLEQINQRNAERAQAEQAQAQEAQAEASKPDARELAKQERAKNSQSFAQAPDTDIMEEEATPEEQEQYTQLELQIVDIINGPNASKMFKIIESATDPVEGIGQVAHDVVRMIDMQNPDTDREVLAALGESAVEQIVQAYEDINSNVNLNEDQVAEAYSVAVQEWMKNNPNDVDPDMKEYLAGPPPRQM